MKTYLATVLYGLSTTLVEAYIPLSSRRGSSLPVSKIRRYEATKETIESNSWSHERRRLSILKKGLNPEDDEIMSMMNFNIEPKIQPTYDESVLQLNPTSSTSSIPPEPQLFQQRWIQLAYLSLLALLSDWICFSVASTPATFETSYPGHSASTLIDIFLFTNVVSCFMVTDVVSKIGLGWSVKCAAGLMAVGCLLRSGMGFVMDPIMKIQDILGGNGGAADIGGMLSSSWMGASHAINDAVTTATPDHGLVPYGFLLAGTIAVGAAQPFFQCTPPLLSAQWFASDERATSTAIALNFNQIGIATAFLVGGTMASNPDGLASYFGLISAMSLIIGLGTFVQFEDKPPVPPSSSEMEKIIRGEKEPPFFESVQKLFRTPGFTMPLLAFICSISITNIVGAFIDDIMHNSGITNQNTIDMAGAGFEVAILMGGIILGGYVDKTKNYKTVTLACIAATVLSLIPIGMGGDIGLGGHHALIPSAIMVLMALFGLGAFAGPIQPINAELAVDVSYPSDETAIESVQQIGGNLASALLVPLIEWASTKDVSLADFLSAKTSDLMSLGNGEEFEIRGDVLVLIAIALATYGYFHQFDSPLKRSIADRCQGKGVGDEDYDEDCRISHLYQHDDVQVLTEAVPAFNHTISG